MRIRGIEGLTAEEVEELLRGGARFVFFEYCVSVVVATLRRPSAVYLVPAGDLGIARGLPYTLLSLFLGWWGVPWGLLYTPLVLLTNLSGGCDVTPQVRDWLRQPRNSDLAD